MGVLDGVRVLDSATIARFTVVQDPRLSHRALGWETASGSNSGGGLMSPTAFGHTGFTGTSIWIDPTRDLVIVVLSNRVHPTRDNARWHPVRRLMADLVVRTLYPSEP